MWSLPHLLPYCLIHYRNMKDYFENTAPYLSVTFLGYALMYAYIIPCGTYGHGLVMDQTVVS